MFQRPILMNEEGASPGGGAPAPAVVAADTQAQGTAPSGVVTMDALKSVLTEAMTSVRNGIHADLRKAGVYDTKPAKASTQVDASTPTQASTTQADYQQMFARETAFTRAVASAGLTDEQYSIVEETYRAVNPPDPRAWATGFLKAMGLGKKEPAASPQPAQNENNKQATAGSATAAQPAQVKPTTNISDMGPSASSAARDPEAIIRHRITDATNDDFERLANQHGRDKAQQMWVAEARSQLRNIKLIPPNRQR